MLLRSVCMVVTKMYALRITILWFICGFLSVQAADFKPDDFDIKCTAGGFYVSISKSKAENLVFSFIDQSCHAVGNNTHMVARTAYNQCGTIKREYNEGTAFTNELLDLNYHGKDDCPHLKLKVTCFHLRQNHHNGYERKRRSIESRIDRTSGCDKSQYAFDQPETQNKLVTCPFIIGVGEPIQPDGTLSRTKVTSHPLKVKSQKIPCKPLKNKGRLHLVMGIASDETYTTTYEQNPEPMQIEWYENVYYQISHLSGHDNYKLVPILCHATPDSDPNNPMSYVYIANGCPVDPTVRFYPSTTGVSRFSITTFQFQNSKSRSFYSHCEVLVCDKEDTSPQCQRQCQTTAPGVQQKRKRRNVSKYKLIKTSKGYRLVKVAHNKPCYRFFYIKKFGGNLHVNFKVLVPRGSNFIKRTRKLPFKIVPTENESEIHLRLKAGDNVSYNITECSYGRSKILSYRRKLRNTGYDDVITIKDNQKVIVHKSHHKFEENKRSTLECYVSLCDHGTDCSNKCPRKIQSHVQRKRGKRNVESEAKPKNEVNLHQTQEEKEVKVTCLEDQMIIRINKQTQNTFHLKDPGCIAMSGEDGGYTTISTSYNGCGTTMHVDSQWLYYTNEVVEKPAPNSMIIRGPLLKQTVKCAYKKRSVSAPVLIATPDRKRLISHGFGFYKVQIDMYQDGSFANKNTKSLVEIGENNDMYFEVKINSAPFINNLELHLDTCLGYNQPTEAEQQKSYVFIKDGCPYKDKTVQFYPTSDASKVRFSVKPFKFGNDASIMINCYVTACSVKAKQSKCKELSTLGREKYCELKKSQ